MTDAVVMPPEGNIARAFAHESIIPSALLVEQTKVEKGHRRINYHKFTHHDTKFNLASDYLQSHCHEKCIILNVGWSYTPKFSWRSYTIGLLAKTEARLAIFYVDFEYRGHSTKELDIMEIPKVDMNVLKDAIDELQSVVNNDLK